MAKKRILIGLGNPIMSDDRLGLIVAEEVHKRLPGFDLDLSCYCPLDIIDRITGYDRAVLIDSMVTSQLAPGTVRRVDVSQDLTVHCGTTHGMGLSEAIQVARACGVRLPGEILIYGIEVEDPFTIGSQISSALKERLTEVVDSIVEDIGSD